MFNLGIIVPQSNYLPKLSRDLPVACKMGLNSANPQINLVFEPAGYNESTDVIKDKLQGMIMRENLHAVLCPLNSSLIEPVNELCLAEDVILIVNTMGEDVIFESALSDSMFINSYQLWQSAWLTGHYAANSGYQNLAAIYSRHDGGYGVPLAVAVGAEAGDANVKSTQISHMDSSDEDCTELLRELDKMEPDATIVHHFGKEAVNFLRDIESVKLKSPLITLPTFVEDLTLNQLDKRIEGMKTVSVFDTDTAEYKRFLADFKQQTGRIAHPHVIMAYESVQLLTAALESTNDHSFESMVDVLKSISISGPRGDVSFNPDNKNSSTHYYVREVCKGASGERYNKTLSESEVPILCHEHYQLAQKNTVKQGWVNPYLIA